LQLKLKFAVIIEKLPHYNILTSRKIVNISKIAFIYNYINWTGKVNTNSIFFLTTNFKEFIFNNISQPDYIKYV